MPNMLSPAVKATLLLFRLLDNGTRKTPLVLTREATLRSVSQPPDT